MTARVLADMKFELQTIEKKNKGLGLLGLILLSLLSFGICAAGIFYLAAERNKKLAALNSPEHLAGFFDGNTYVNPLLGWKIELPSGMSLLNQDQMKEWQKLPEMYGFEAKAANQGSLFLALGEAFSVVAIAWIEPLNESQTIIADGLVMDNALEKFKESISRRTLLESNWEVTELIIDGRHFKRMSIRFHTHGDLQKQQDIFTGVINNQLLNISVVYYKPAAGNQIIHSILSSEFGS